LSVLCYEDGSQATITIGDTRISCGVGLILERLVAAGI